MYKTDGKQMLHNKPLPKDCYRVSIEKSLVDAACIPDVGSNGLKTVKDAVGGFYAWPKDQVVFDEKVHRCMCFINLHISFFIFNSVFDTPAFVSYR